MLRVLLYLFVAIAFTTSAVGCKKGQQKKKVDKIAMEDCTRTPAEQASGDACRKCCEAAGATGHAWSDSDGCQCIAP